MADPYLSVVVPAYNEDSRIAKSLQQIVAYLRKQPYSSEVIVIDDGSSDRTVPIAEECLCDFPHTILRNETNRGKGLSVKKGMLLAKGKYVLFSDADLSTPIEEVGGFLKELETGYDLVIGSRALKGSNVVRHQPLLRESLGRLFNRIARLLTFQGVLDSQCGFKCFSKTSAEDLFNRQKLERFSFDVEIIYLAQKRGYRILEKPVMWINSPNSRVRMWCDPLNMIIDIFRIRWIHRNDHI